MRKKDEIADPKSCLNKAKDDELLFVLLERDAAAPGAVQCWIRERIRLGLNAAGDPQIIKAQAWIDSVSKWEKT